MLWEGILPRAPYPFFQLCKLQTLPKWIEAQKNQGTRKSPLMCDELCRCLEHAATEAAAETAAHAAAEAAHAAAKAAHATAEAAHAATATELLT